MYNINRRNTNFTPIKIIWYNLTGEVANVSNLKLENDIEKLLDILPQKIRQCLNPQMLEDAIEIVLDLGRVPEIRNSGGNITYLDTELVNDSDIIYITSRVQ